MAFLDLMTRIEENSIEHGDCWMWQGSINPNGGCPMISYRGKVMSVHRAIAKSKFMATKGLFCYAKCGNKLCVNPAHAGVQTRSEAIKRGWSKKDKQKVVMRMAKARKGSTGITDEMVKLIRESDKTPAELEKELGKDRRTIWRIKNHLSRPDYSNPWTRLWT